METLQERMLQALGDNCGHCLDSEEERREVANDLTNTIGAWFIDGLHKIKDGIEADNFTRENIDALIRRI